MARPLYSARFGSGSLPAGNYLIGTVPAGFVWVLRDLDGYANVSAFERVDILLRGDSGQGIAYLEWKPSEQNSKQWTGRQVIPPGGQVHILVGGTTDVDFALSGYVLAFP